LLRIALGDSQQALRYIKQERVKFEQAPSAGVHSNGIPRIDHLNVCVHKIEQLYLVGPNESLRMKQAHLLEVFEGPSWIRLSRFHFETQCRLRKLDWCLDL